ncbi:hypothetical protein I4U23_003883 [Adineta vaga]|nr:hypothetical protein I4U23_003883 [Adineta vaga]
MGQQLFKVEFQSINSNDTPLNSTEILYDDEHQSIPFFFPLENVETTTDDTEQVFIDKIRKHLFGLTHSNELEQINLEINRILTNEIFPSINDYYKKVIEQIKLNLENQHQFRTSLLNKFKEDEDKNQPFIEDFIEDEIDQQSNTSSETILFYCHSIFSNNFTFIN